LPFNLLISSLPEVPYIFALNAGIQWNVDTWKISDGSETPPWAAIDGNRYTIYSSPSADPFPYVEIRLPQPQTLYRFGLRSEYPIGTPDDNEVEDFLQASYWPRISMLKKAHATRLLNECFAKLPKEISKSLSGEDEQSVIGGNA